MHRGKIYWNIREAYVRSFSFMKMLIDKPRKNTKKRLLFYHLAGLDFGGTEKYLQILAKHLDKNKYDVYFLHPELHEEGDKRKSRLNYIRDGKVIAIPFAHERADDVPPHFVSGMNPEIHELIKALNIDILVMAEVGGANYPLTTVRNIPIIMINIFGVPNVQKNIVYHICISEEVSAKLEGVVSKEKRVVFPVPSEPPLPEMLARGKAIREKFGIKDSDFVFGRIGRPSDGIFDPIGINAFELIVKNHPEAHYIIMAPMPALKSIVSERNIPNVHYIDPSYEEEDIWGFHGSLDALAHFRFDGESFGLNIAESMIAGNPILSHKSHIWNAHLEYLDSNFSLVSEKDDFATYAKNMESFIAKKKNSDFQNMRRAAEKKGRELFLIDTTMKRFEELIETAFNK
ncbi:MAG TPA: hypothetical protein VJ579_04755 [Candidatus Paceibacterota bacterium]|nr:hypothetical protein [Candidatus Paceibacterota bacterium]